MFTLTARPKTEIYYDRNFGTVCIKQIDANDSHIVFFSALDIPAVIDGLEQAKDEAIKDASY